MSRAETPWHDGEMTIQIAQDAHADAVLNASPFALLGGMLLDQRSA
jgi:hypothetical protein